MFVLFELLGRNVDGLGNAIFILPLLFTILYFINLLLTRTIFTWLSKVKVIGIIIYVVAAILAGVLIWLATALTGWIPAVGTIIGWLLGIVSTLVGLYALAGIVIEVLVFAKVLKD